MGRTDRATVAVASSATFLSLVVFTAPLATLPASALGTGLEGQAWICAVAPTSWSGLTQLGIGLTVVAVGQLLLVGAAPGSSPWRYVPGLLVAGITTGVVNSVLGREAVASAPRGRAGMGSGANNTARYVGSAIGTTVVAVIANEARPAACPAGLLEGFDTALLVATAVTVAGVLGILACRPRRRHRDVPLGATPPARGRSTEVDRAGGA
jgi:sugar phosphate permease